MPKLYSNGVGQIAREPGLRWMDVSSTSDTVRISADKLRNPNVFADIWRIFLQPEYRYFLPKKVAARIDGDRDFRA